MTDKTKTEVRLTSTPWINTPGVLRWTINGYKFKKNRKAMRWILTKGYNLTDEVADGLLSGKIPHRIEGEDVVFEVEDEYKRAAVVM